MDEQRQKKTKERLDYLKQEVVNLDTDTGVKNVLVHTVGVLEDMREDVENAHHRIDQRKKEHEELMDKLTALESELKKSNRIQAEINNNIARQASEADKIGKRRWIFMAVMTLIMLVNTFGSFKGASIASSIWNALKVII